MSATPPLASVHPAMPGRRRIILSALLLASAGCFGYAVARDLAERREVRGVLERSALLRPADGIVETIAAVPSADQAAAFAAETLLDRAPTAASGAAAAELAARALEARPASAHYLVTLGRAALQRRDAELPAGQAPVWKKALTLAAASAPGFSVATTGLADAFLETWPGLTAPERAEASTVLSRAFASPEYVRRAFPQAISRMGVEAVKLLPENPGALRAGAAALRVSGREAEAAGLDARADRLGAASSGR